MATNKVPIPQAPIKELPQQQNIKEIHNLGAQYGMNDKMLGWIQEKAGRNEAMDTVTPEKQAVYDAYQKYMMGEVATKAQTGTSLSDPTQWKNDLYNQYSQDAKMNSMYEWMQNSANGQMQQQEAQLGLARDEELAAIQKQLQQAISQGQLSVKEAEAQYAAAEGQINRKAYKDSEYTNMMMQQRGIGNSMQGVGLMQGDQARQNSLLNQNVTTRDQQINTINNQLDMIRNNALTDTTLANSKYNYGIANAQGAIQQQMADQIYGFQSEDYFNQQQQGFALEQMGQQNQYQLQQMQQQQNFDLQKLSTQQKYQLEQMAKSYGYDLGKMSVQQQYQLAQMAQGFGYDMSLQNSNQNFQAGQNSLDRQHDFAIQELRNKHDLSMLSAEQQSQLDMYDVELQRKLALYTPGTAEHDLLLREADWAYSQVEKENLSNLLSEVGATQLAALTSSYPETLPDLSDKKAVDAYNAKVESINKQIERIIDDPSSQQYLRDLEEASGVKSSTSDKPLHLRVRENLLKWNPLGIVPRAIYDKVKSP